ncbi:DUF3221 domain-containing protein [Paenibacillus hodogayensis]|uniref:DUF3221 domain-containing protein n=1 Tax=Paenibacillus hodogayensis TaxID=279208 RepID=A0ABV5W634_9BACL
MSGNGSSSLLLSWLAVACLLACSACGGASAAGNAGQQSDGQKQTVLQPSEGKAARELPSSDRAAMKELSLPAEGQTDKIDLAEINGKLLRHVEDLKEKHSVQVLAFGTGKDHMMMTVRRYGDVDKPIAVQELKEVRQSLYEYAGGPFPIELSVRACCESTADVAGTIRKVESDRVLVVDASRTNGNTKDPVAVWITLSEDGKVVRGGDRPETVSFESLTVGMRVQAWSTGLTLQSYPGQSSVVKIEIVGE